MAPAVAHPEAGDDLVEDHEGAGLVAGGAEALEEARGGRHQAHVGGHRLDDDAGHVGARSPGTWVEGGDEGVGHGRGGDPGGVGQAEGWPRRCRRRPGGSRRGRGSTGELDDRRSGPLAPCGPGGSPLMPASVPLETMRTISRLPGLGLMMASASSTSRLIGGGAVGGAGGRRPGDDRLHFWDGRGPGWWPRRTAPSRRSGKAVHVPYVGTLGPGHEIRGAADGTEGPHRRVHPARDDAFGAGEELLATPAGRSPARSLSISASSPAR